MINSITKFLAAGCLLITTSSFADAELNRCLQNNVNSADRFKICYGQMQQRAYKKAHSERKQSVDYYVNELEKVEDAARQKDAKETTTTPTENAIAPIQTSTPPAPPSVKPRVIPQITQPGVPTPKKDSEKKPEKPDYPVQYY